MPIHTSNSSDAPQQRSTLKVAAGVSLKPEGAKRSVRARLRQKSAQRRRRSLRSSAVEPATVWETCRSWQRGLREWATGPEGVSVAASAAVHVMLFMGLMLVLYLLGLRLDEHPGDRGPINAVFTETNVDNTPEFETLADVEFELDDAAAGELMTLNSESINDNLRFVPDTTFSSVADATALLPALPENALDLVNEASGAKGKSWKRGGFAMPRNKGKVITQGSFSVWTVPEDPLPFQSYRIVIQLNRRVAIRELRQDVTGTVTGTDGYRASIGSVQPGFHFPRQLAIPKARQIAIQIPAAKYELVRDVIEVHSKTLDESQKIEIVF